MSYYCQGMKSSHGLTRCRYSRVKPRRPLGQCKASKIEKPRMTRQRRFILSQESYANNRHPMVNLQDVWGICNGTNYKFSHNVFLSLCLKPTQHLMMRLSRYRTSYTKNWQSSDSPSAPPLSFHFPIKLGIESTSFAGIVKCCNTCTSSQLRSPWLSQITARDVFHSKLIPKQCIDGPRNMRRLAKSFINLLVYIII